VNTKSAPHRDLNFASVDDVVAELDRMQAAHDAGTLQTTGNWSPGQMLQHIDKVWRMGLDGVDFKAPLPLRLIFGPLKGMFVKKQPPRGIKLQGDSAQLLPDGAVSFEDGMAALRKTLQRLRDGEKMTHPSALFGKMSHEQWLSLNLNHAAMHLGFVRYGEA
jgi:hypothetical protein